jgi:hypothetical protein
MGKISHKVQREDFGWADKDLRDDLYGLCPFDELIDDMLRFDANNWTPSDQTVAAMLSVLGETPVKVRNNRKEDLTKSLTLDSLFKKYKL